MVGGGGVRNIRIHPDTSGYVGTIGQDKTEQNRTEQDKGKDSQTKKRSAAQVYNVKGQDMGITTDEILAAEEWLLQELSRGSRKATTLIAAGEKAGHSLAALQAVLWQRRSVRTVFWRDCKWFEIAHGGQGSSIRTKY